MHPGISLPPLSSPLPFISSLSTFNFRLYLSIFTRLANSPLPTSFVSPPLVNFSLPPPPPPIFHPHVNSPLSHFISVNVPLSLPIFPPCQFPSFFHLSSHAFKLFTLYQFSSDFCHFPSSSFIYSSSAHQFSSSYYFHSYSSTFCSLPTVNSPFSPTFISPPPANSRLHPFFFISSPLLLLILFFLLVLISPVFHYLSSFFSFTSSDFQFYSYVRFFLF